MHLLALRYSRLFHFIIPDSEFMAMSDAWRERVVYYGIAAALGVLLLLNFLGIFKTFFGIDTAVLIALLSGYKTFYNSLAALLEKRDFRRYGTLHCCGGRVVRGAKPCCRGGHVHRTSGRGPGVLRRRPDQRRRSSDSSNRCRAPPRESEKGRKKQFRLISFAWVI